MPTKPSAKPDSAVCTHSPEVVKNSTTSATAQAEVPTITTGVGSVSLLGSSGVCRNEPVTSGGLIGSLTW